MKAVRARKLGRSYRNGPFGFCQEYLVTMADGSERRVTVPAAYGRDAARIAKQYAEARESGA